MQKWHDLQGLLLICRMMFKGRWLAVSNDIE